MLGKWAPVGVPRHLASRPTSFRDIFGIGCWGSIAGMICDRNLSGACIGDMGYNLLSNWKYVVGRDVAPDKETETTLIPN